MAPCWRSTSGERTLGSKLLRPRAASSFAQHMQQFTARVPVFRARKVGSGTELNW